MKKLMIIAAVAMAAFASNAAAFTWKTSATGKVYTPGESTTLLGSATAYLFDSASVTQQAILTAFDGGTFNTLTALDSSAVSAGAIAAKAGTPIVISEGNVYTLDAIAAIITTVGDKDYIYISDINTKAGAATGTAQLNLALATSSKAAVTEFTAGSATFVSGGWYTAAVPEPTSGLLMLIGMAGLALCRRRA